MLLIPRLLDRTVIDERHGNSHTAFLRLYTADSLGNICFVDKTQRDDLLFFLTKKVPEQKENTKHRTRNKYTHFQWEPQLIR